MMLAATTLFAEFRSFNCEIQGIGACTYEQSENYFCETCSCAEGVGYAARNCGDFAAPFPTVEECFDQINNVCKNTEFRCENNAGKCFIAEDGVYACQCFGVWSANGAVEGTFYGTVERSEESCKSKLVEICGTEPATVRDVCEDTEIANKCISHIKSVDTCRGRQWPDEDIKAIFDLTAYGNHVGETISDCCQKEDYRKANQTKWECLDNCTDEDCCQTCGFYFDEGVVSSEEDSAEDAAAANTEVPTDGAAPEDTADGDSSAPAENKEESKSDGCSVLFI